MQKIMSRFSYNVIKHQIPGWTLAAAALVAVLALPSVRAVAQAPAQAGQSAAGAADDHAWLFSSQWNVGAGEAPGNYDLEGVRDVEGNTIQNVRYPPGSHIIDPADGKIPYQPWALKLKNTRRDRAFDPKLSRDLDTESKCYPSGMPHFMWRGGVVMQQFPNYIVMQMEWGHQYRIIPTDGRPHLAPGLKLWYGDPRAHWEGSDLVIETTNLNAEPSLTMSGDFMSDDATLVERFHRIDARNGTWDVTVTDPNVYTRPYTIRFKLRTGGGGGGGARGGARGGNAAADNNQAFGGDGEGGGGVGAVAPGQVPEVWEAACVEGNRHLAWRELSKQIGRHDAQPPKDARGPEQ